MKRAPITACIAVLVVCVAATTAAAQSKSSRQAVRRQVSVERQSSAGEVRIAPTTMVEGNTSLDIGGDHWNARGYDLKTLLSEIFDVDARRIDFAGDADSRYDVSLTLTHEIDADAMQQILQNALERKFGLTIRPENRAMEVYVLTAPNGPGTGLHRHSANSAEQADDVEKIEFLGKKCDGVSSGGITASAGTLGEFQRTLEPDLDRLLIDETGLKGNYDFQLGAYANQNQLFQELHDQLGIVVTPQQRSVTVLAVRPAAGEMQAAL